jgi:hypothetical protein
LSSGKGISDVEGYELVKEAVSYYWHLKYSYLGDRGCEKSDITNEIYLKLYRKGYFKKWNSKRAGKKVYISRAVKNSIIDMHRAYRQTNNVSYEDYRDEGKRLEDKLPSKLTKDEIEESEIYDIVCRLPDENYSKDHYYNMNQKIRGDTPIGDIELNAKNVAVLLILGYTVREIANMFESPWGEGKITRPTIYRIRDTIKDEFIKCGYI